MNTKQIAIAELLLKKLVENDGHLNTDQQDAIMTRENDYKWFEYTLVKDNLISDGIIERWGNDDYRIKLTKKGWKVAEKGYENYYKEDNMDFDEMKRLREQNKFLLDNYSRIPRLPDNVQQMLSGFKKVQEMMGTTKINEMLEANRKIRDIINAGQELKARLKINDDYNDSMKEFMTQFHLADINEDLGSGLDTVTIKARAMKVNTIDDLKEFIVKTMDEKLVLQKPTIDNSVNITGDISGKVVVSHDTNFTMPKEKRSSIKSVLIWVFGIVAALIATFIAYKLGWNK
jgi:hypothetical protein